jgi:hypothetical protein
MSKGRGRPRVEIDFAKALEAAGFGLNDDEISKALGVSRSSWMRYLANDEGARAQIQVRRSNSAVATWRAITREVEKGRLGAATILLRRLERGHLKLTAY